MDTVTEQEIELSIEQAKAFIAVGEALARLENNPDFKLVIGDGYFKENAIRLVHLKCHPQMGTPEKQADIIRAIDGIGELNRYFDVINHQANLALQSIDDGNQALQEMHEEEAADGETD